MKIKHIKNTEAFFKVIDSCTGTVALVTNEGDRLNLRSKLSQFVSLSALFSSDNSIPELELIAYEPEDAKKLLEFMINQ